MLSMTRQEISVRRILLLTSFTMRILLVAPLNILQTLGNPKEKSLVSLSTIVPGLAKLYGQRNNAIRRVWYLQDGARLVHGQLQELQLFHDRVIGLGQDVELNGC